jgi:hypothetical protein
MAPVETESEPMAPLTEASFAGAVCLPFLRAAQNQDGGWGFHHATQSRVEATCWALMALAEASPSCETERQAGYRFLRAAQLSDGSWPPSAEQDTGCWVTSIACWALTAAPEANEAVAASVRWICADWPRKPGAIVRIARRLNPSLQVSAQDDSLRGWGWTPKTASWVEPSALALIALAQVPARLLPRGAETRRRLARALIYDRICPGGGWNCGNPRVYGVAGEPLVEPTVWALLALREDAHRPEIQMSLDWLEKSLSEATGPGSLALAKMCLRVYRRKWPANAPDLLELYGRNEFLGSVPVMAWTYLALNPQSSWLALKAGEGR